MKVRVPLNKQNLARAVEQLFSIPQRTVYDWIMDGIVVEKLKERIVCETLKQSKARPHKFVVFPPTKVSLKAPGDSS